MISVKYGDVLAEPTGIILHGCNNKHVMGAGIALQIKNKYPAVYNRYIREEELELGTIQPVKVADQKYIVNCITQDDFGANNRFVSYDAIANCCEALVERLELTVEHRGLPIMFPKIGAGLGGGNWQIIERIIDETIPDTYEKILFLYE